MSNLFFFNTYKKVTLQLILLLFLYQGIRLLFFCINHIYFKDVRFEEYLFLATQGFRFDLSAIFIINFLYILLALLPAEFVKQKWYQRFINMLFLVSNIPAFLFDLADIGYYPFVRKRMTAEVFHLIGKKSDFIDLLPSYVREFWFVPIAALFFVGGFVFMNSRIVNRHQPHELYRYSIRKMGILLVTLLISFVIMRGGLQLKPIMNASALLVASNEHTPLVLNTPFSILHTLGDGKLNRLNFYADAMVENAYHPIKNYSRGQNSKKCNVVVIILESFGKQYTGIGGRKSYTPFLDSLMSKSLVFTNAFANAHRSADGIPAVLGGIPVFMEDSYMTSPYSNNTIEGLPTLLKKQGYTSSFFHGGTNGTMSFDLFSKSAGFDTYVGRSQYNNDQDYDGTWGIWDEPFLQYYANKLEKQKQPFVSTVFTLSSHEPFRFPKKYEHEEWSKLTGIYKGISYTDMALKKFFATSAKKSWFKNTLFVLTADHNFLANSDSLGYYNAGVGLFSIPIIYYSPSDPDLVGYSKRLTQQIDIIPTILDYLHYPTDFFAFGNSVFDSISPRFSYIQMGEHQQMLFDNSVLTTDNLKHTKMYNYPIDSMLQYPIQQDSLQRVTIGHYKMFKQLLQNTLIDNKQTAKAYKKK